MTQTTDTLSERLEITQEDREAAALIILSRDAVKRVRDGQYDRNPVVQAFACHRLSALRSTAKEVEAYRRALKPFADKARQFSSQPDGMVVVPIDFAHLREANRALTPADPA